MDIELYPVTVALALLYLCKRESYCLSYLILDNVSIFAVCHILYLSDSAAASAGRYLHDVGLAVRAYAGFDVIDTCFHIEQVHKSLEVIMERFVVIG